MTPKITNKGTKLKKLNYIICKKFNTVIHKMDEMTIRLFQYECKISKKYNAKIQNFNFHKLFED